jgi:hypothetical protein
MRADYVHVAEIGNMSMHTDGAYCRVLVNGCQYLHRDGCPVVPYYGEVHTFPLGTRIDGITVVARECRTLSLARKIAPSTPAVAGAVDSAVHSSFEGETYATDAWYPERSYEVHIGCGMVDGERAVVVSVRYFPFRYNPVRNEAVYVSAFSLSIDRTLPARQGTQADAYDLVIITPGEWSDNLEPLALHKETHGIATKIFSLAEIYGGTHFTVQGRDDAEKVKYFVKDAIENWGISYVMLVGGRYGGLFEENWWTPVRYSHTDDGGEGSFVSDLYFADIYKYENNETVFDDWDSNGNGVFAEWTGFRKDTVDLLPDVYVGRLACRTVREVDDMVEKIIAYETETSAGDDWFRTMVVVGGDSAPIDGDPYFEGEEENKAALGYMEGFTPVRLWTSTGTLSGSEDVIDAVSAGCGFLFFDGHGNPMGWSTHPPYDETVWIDGLSVREMNRLSNDGRYPVCVVGGCHNAQINVSILNLFKFWEGDRWLHYIYYGETAYECWAWKLARVSGGGSIATLGYTGYDWFGVGDDGDGIPDCIQRISGFMNVHFFEECGVGGTDILGMAHGNNLVTYITAQNPYTVPLDAKTVEEFILLGDPTLKLGGYGTA